MVAAVSGKGWHRLLVASMARDGTAHSVDHDTHNYVIACAKMVTGFIVRFLFGFPKISFGIPRVGSRFLRILFVQKVSGRCPEIVRREA